jgi:hypothetical protein
MGSRISKEEKAEAVLERVKEAQIQLNMQSIQMDRNCKTKQAQLAKCVRSNDTQCARVAAQQLALFEDHKIHIMTQYSAMENIKYTVQQHQISDVITETMDEVTRFAYDVACEDVSKDTFLLRLDAYKKSLSELSDRNVLMCSALSATDASQVTVDLQRKSDLLYAEMQDKVNLEIIASIPSVSTSSHYTTAQIGAPTATTSASATHVKPMKSM